MLYCICMFYFTFTKGNSWSNNSSGLFEFTSFFHAKHLAVVHGNAKSTSKTIMHMWWTLAKKATETQVCSSDNILYVTLHISLSFSSFVTWSPFYWSSHSCFWTRKPGSLSQKHDSRLQNAIKLTQAWLARQRSVLQKEDLYFRT